MKHISAIFLAAALLLPTTLTSHSANKAIADQAEFSINSALRLPQGQAQQSATSKNLALQGSSAKINRRL